MRPGTLAVMFSCVCQALFGANPTSEGLIGGQFDFPYAALVRPDGTVQKLDGLPPTGVTFRVAMNRSGEGLVGGTSGVDAYAGRVFSNGALKEVEGLIAPGEIYSVAINKSSSGIVGGGHLNTNVPYAALVSREGIATSIAGLPASGLVYGVAIDPTGAGLVGGVGPLDSAYAATVTPSGILTPVTGLPTNGGIFWVAVNDSQQKFIGGKDGVSVYAAFIDPNGSLNPVADLPAGLLYSVGLNSSGRAIIGGASLNLPYAALVSSNGTATPLTGLPDTAGIIYNVTLNNAGTGLIAGFSTEGPFGAFVTPNGTLRPLKNLPEGPGFLDGAAIHSTGIALVGGVSNGDPFAAVVAPNGTLTYLKGLPQHGEINTTAISTLDHLVPKSIGPFTSWVNTQFTLSNALTQHCGFHHRNQCACEEPACTLWVSLFGNSLREKRRHHSPSFSNAISGVVLGYDFNRFPDLALGAAVAYAYNDVHYSNHFGHASLNQESAVVYATLNKCHFYLSGALWGGYLHGYNKRRSFEQISSRSHPTGWNLAPHFEIGFPLGTPCPHVSFEPFAAFDWVNNWQRHLREHGSSGFNIVLKNQHVSILRSEVGLRLYQTFNRSCGCFILQEKASYVNRTALHKGSCSTHFVGSASNFDIETIASSGQNRGVAEVHIEWQPSNQNFYTALDYQGEFGSSFYSNMLTIEVGKTF